MTVRTEPWPQGTPAWVSLTVSDVGAATGFYGDLFGWDFLEGSTPDGRVYLTALKDGRPVAGIGQAVGDESAAQWTTYLATDDVAASTEAARIAGAEVAVPPADVGRAGRVALLADGSGAYVGLWQAGEHTGAAVTEEPGSMVWNELLTDDVTAAKVFYATLFGYSYEDMSGPGFTYVAFHVDGRPAGGIGALEGSRPRAEEPHWLVYFAAGDVDAAVTLAATHGGEPEGPPFDSPYGRIVVLRGPERERLALLAPARAPSDPEVSG